MYNWLLHIKTHAKSNVQFPSQEAVLCSLIIQDQGSSTHLSFGLVLLVFFGSAAGSLGSDMVSSISEEGTAFIPLWILPHTQSEVSTQGIRGAADG